MDYDRNFKADLHIHSDASDGTLSAADIIELAAGLGMGAISITDHDTLSGSIQAIRHGIPSSIQFITGVEISAGFPSFYPGQGSIHILGYGMNPDDVDLNHRLAALQNSRKNRNPLVIQRLTALGIDISLEAVIESAGSSQLGRPHIAQYLVQRGIVSTIDEAFDLYLGNGKPAYVEKDRIPYEQALEIIIAAGGLPVLAHPYLIRSRPDALLDDLVRESVALGLKGIEAFYPEHTPAETAHCLELARKNGLLITGGTDFHGAIKPGVQIGAAKGDFSVPYHYLIDFFNAVSNTINKS